MMKKVEEEFLIRRNSAEFKMVKNILDDMDNDPSIRKHLHLFTIKPGEPASKMIVIDTRTGQGKMFYEMALEQMQFNLLDSGHKLYRYGNSPVYFFYRNSNSGWIETPFEVLGAAGRKLKNLF